MGDYRPDPGRCFPFPFSLYGAPVLNATDTLLYQAKKCLGSLPEADDLMYRGVKLVELTDTELRKLIFKLTTAQQRKSDEKPVKFLESTPATAPNPLYNMVKEANEKTIEFVFGKEAPYFQDTSKGFLDAIKAQQRKFDDDVVAGFANMLRDSFDKNIKAGYVGKMDDWIDRTALVDLNSEPSTDKIVKDKLDSQVNNWIADRTLFKAGDRVVIVEAADPGFGKVYQGNCAYTGDLGTVTQTFGGKHYQVELDSGLFIKVYETQLATTPEARPNPLQKGDWVAITAGSEWDGYRGQVTVAYVTRGSWVKLDGDGPRVPVLIPVGAAKKVRRFEVGHMVRLKPGLFRRGTFMGGFYGHKGEVKGCVKTGYKVAFPNRAFYVTVREDEIVPDRDPTTPFCVGDHVKIVGSHCNLNGKLGTVKRITSGLTRQVSCLLHDVVVDGMPELYSTSYQMTHLELVKKGTWATLPLGNTDDSFVRSEN